MALLTEAASFLRATHPEHADAIVGGLRRYREGESAEQAFALAGDRARSFADECMLRAARLIDPHAELSPWKLAGEVAIAIRRFGLRRRVLDFEALGELDRELWRAMTSCKRVPKSRERIYRLLTQHPLLRQCESAETLGT